MSIDIIKSELKTECQYELALPKVKYSSGVSFGSLMAFVYLFQDEEIESQMRPPSIEFDRIIYLMNLLEDYQRVATAGISWLWNAPTSILPTVSCPDCGVWFHGINRMLALVKHIQTNHSSAAIQLMITSMDQYGKLIRHMDRVLKCEIETLVERHL